MYVMGKKRNNRKKEILTISFNPTDIVVIASGKNCIGIPDVKCTGAAPIWLEAIRDFSTKMESTYNDEGINDFIEFAAQESIGFVKHLLDLYRPGYIALPAKEELEELIYGDNDTVDGIMSLTFHFAEIMHQTFINMAQDRKIHFFIVPFSTEFASTMDKSKYSRMETNLISLLYITKAIDMFMLEHHRFIGSGTIIPWMPNGEDNADVDYNGKCIIAVHFSTDYFASIKESNGKTTYYDFSDRMHNDSPKVSDGEISDIESIISKIKSNLPDVGVMFMESELPAEGTPRGMNREHFEELSSYAIQNITAEAMTKGIYVIVLPESNRIAEFETDFPVETANDDEYIQLLSSRAERFLKKHPILPGIATIL